MISKASSQGALPISQCQPDLTSATLFFTSTESKVGEKGVMIRVLSYRGLRYYRCSKGSWEVVQTNSGVHGEF